MNSKAKNTAIKLTFLGLWFLMLPLGLYAQKVELERNINQEYSTESSTRLMINNKYGDVVVNTWNVDKITVDVEVKAWGRSESQAQSMLDRVEIEYGQSGDEVSFRTEISSRSVSINDRSGFQINYTVNMPMKNHLELENKYGAVNLGDLSGELDLEVGYGQLQAGDLTNDNVEIVLKYSKGSIQSVNKGSLEFKYSGNVNIGRVGEITLSDKYGGVSIDEAGIIDADIAYSGLKIGTLTGALRLESKYAGGNIQNVKAGFKEIDIDNSYGSVSIEFDQGANFDFEVETSFGGFKSSIDDLNMQKMIEKNTSGEYSGSRGSDNKGRVAISSAFGSVKFK